MVRDVPRLVLGEALGRTPDILHTTQHRRQHTPLTTLHQNQIHNREATPRASKVRVYLKSTAPEPSGGTTPPNPAESNAEAAPPLSAARPCELTARV